MVAITSSISQSAVAKILSKLLNQPIHEQQVNPLVAYLGALSAVLVGVTHADGQVTDEEKQRLGKTLTQFIPSSSALNSVVRSLVQGVRESKIYAKPVELATLTSLFAESEKLLLIMFGYEMATADGNLDPKEQKYLRIIAQHLHLKDEWIEAVEAGLVHQQMSDALSEVRYLLDPARFQALDPVFARAASQMLTRLPESAKSNGTRVKVGYETLEKFQAQRQQLDRFCGELGQIVSECHDRTPLPQQLETKLQEIAQRLQSQKFRVAVVGEFSQGKSTLLNALLGEEIQPTRVIPCSGSITVLRYGEQKRVICHYRNGQEEIIPLEEYQARASIPDDVALGNRADALTSDVLEIMYEHPGLALCRHGVELIDSPGLNEHPERTRITNQLLENVDAVIFLANGSRPMTQGERELLHSLKLKLNGGQADRPANNLFVLVNFMDLLRREPDRQQVRQLVENSVFGEPPILETSKQLHFISAQVALEAIVEGDNQNDYLKTFRGFTQVLETFLTQERGAIVNQRSQADLNGVAQSLTLQLKQAEEIIAGEVEVSNAAKQDIVDKIGEASGYLANLQTLIRSTSEQKRDVVKRLEIKQHLKSYISEKSASWNSKQGQKSKILTEFSDKFQSDLSDAISEWTQTTVIQETLTSTLKAIDSNVQSKIYQFQKSAEAIDQGTGSQLAIQFDLGMKQVAPQFKFDADVGSDKWDSAWKIGIGSISGLGGGGLLVGGIALAVSSVAFFPLVLTGGAIAGIAAGGAALGTAVGGALGFLIPPDQEAIKREVIEEGFKQFHAQDGTGQLMKSLDALVESLFNQRLETIQAVTRQYMALLNSLLIDSEAVHTLNEVAAERQWYQEQHSKLVTFQSQLNDLLV
ncbi:MAG: dynamin family protein [Phormidesmis sp. CAN_BIN44]|nr:dynamin family protein [Phormidesmis sp. CAN_BIN44]